MDTVFTTIDAVKAALPAVTVGINGAGGSASLSTSILHVDKSNKGVIGVNNGYLVGKSVGYAIWAAQGFPATVLDVTADHVTSAASGIANALYRYAVWDLAAAGNIVLQVRANDMMREVDYDAVTDIAKVTAFGEHIARGYVDDADFAAIVAPAPRIAFAGLAANALHRHACEGHNWFTGETSKKSSVTGRLLKVAGGEIGMFTMFMTKYGHDMWHFLATPSMMGLMDAFTGHTVVNLAAGYRINGVIATGRQYNMSEAIGYGPAVTDRWPPGTIGKSAIIVAVPVIVSMFDHLTMKLVGLDILAFSKSAMGVMISLRTAQPTRDELVALRGAFQTITSQAVGFAAAVDAESAERFASLAAFASRDQQSYDAGRVLGKWAKGKDMVDDAVVNRVKGLISTATISMDNIASMLAKVAGGTAPRVAVNTGGNPPGATGPAAPANANVPGPANAPANANQPGGGGSGGGPGPAGNPVPGGAGPGNPGAGSGGPAANPPGAGPAGSANVPPGAGPAGPVANVP